MNDPAPNATTQTPPVERVPDTNVADLDAIWEQEWQQKLLEAAIERVKIQVSAEQYQMFDFYVIKKMPPGKVARDLGVSAAQVYLAKHRVSRLLKKEVQRLDTEMG